LCVPISGLILVIHTMELVVGNMFDIISHSNMRRDFYRRD
jgi:hypothetical protein